MLRRLAVSLIAFSLLGIAAGEAPPGACTPWPACKRVEPSPSPSPSPAPGAKAIARGVFSRGALPPAGTAIRVATVDVDWNDLEPTRDAVTLAPIESVLDASDARGLDGVRLRVMLGIHSPGWAKSLGSGPITYTEPHSGAIGSIPDLWDAGFQAEAAELFAAIAARYDADPRLRLIFATGAMTWYGEPLLRGIADPTNCVAFLAAGYTRAADEALQRAELDWLRPFAETPIGLAYNPHQYCNPDGSVGTSAAFMGSVMDYQIATFGDRAVLQNNSIRSSYIANPPQMYDYFLARVDAPGTTSYQTAAPSRIGDPQATMDWAIDYLHASGVEVTQSVFTDAELSGYDTRLAAQTQ